MKYSIICMLLLVLTSATGESIHRTLAHGETVRLTWPAIPGQTYRVLMTTNLTAQVWVDVSKDGVYATNTVASYLHTNRKSMAFFKVIKDERASPPSSSDDNTSTLIEESGINTNLPSYRSHTTVNFPDSGILASELTIAASHRKAVSRIESELFMVVDLSEGPDARKYPVSYLDAVPEGGWPDEFKTTKLVLRRIPPGTFLMGSPTNEFGRLFRSEAQQEITISQPFYIGVFEVTQKQWERVMGTWPSYFNNPDYRNTRPVETVSYDMIRGSKAGAGYPDTNAVDANSFIGRLRLRTGYAFDLPTEPQWEYAARSGSTTALHSGKNVTASKRCPNVSEVARYWYNGGSGRRNQSGNTTIGTAKVGSYMANAWGLFDFHGNVSEWCLEKHKIHDIPGVRRRNPKVIRMRRGGSMHLPASFCRAAIRLNQYQDYKDAVSGLRLVSALD